MSGLDWLVIGSAAYLLLAWYAHSRLFSRYKRLTGPLVRALSPKLARTHWIYVISSRCLFFAAVAAVVFFVGRVDVETHRFANVAILWIALFVCHVVISVAGWAGGFYPVSGGFRSRYIVEDVPVSRLLVDLALAMPVVGFAWGFLVLPPPG